MKELTNQDKMILTELEHLLEDVSNLKENAESIKHRLETYQGMIHPSDYQAKLIREGIEEAGFAIHYITGLAGYIRPLVQMVGMDGPALRKEYRK